MNENIRFDFYCALQRVKALLESRILWSINKELYINSVFTELLINMRDISFKSEKYLDHRLKFTNDIIQKDPQKIKDVTDLIKFFRDSVCHNESPNLTSGIYKFSFVKLMYKEKFINPKVTKLENIYIDDIAFIMGGEIIYLKRHLEKSFYDVYDKFTPYIY